MGNDKKAELNRHLNATIQAIGEIKGKHGKSNAQGEIECPLCKGKLFYTVASLNGHVWGKCKTEDCLSWME